MKTLTATTLNSINLNWIKEFSQERKEPSWVLDLREKAFASYTLLPWPSGRDEKWKRSDLGLLAFDKLKLDSSELESKEPNFSSALKTNSDLVKDLWSKAIQQAAGNKFLLLTLALASDGAFVTTTKKEGSKTTHLPLFDVPSATAKFVFNIVQVDENSELQLWEENQDTASTGDFGFLGSYTALVVKSNAHASHYAVQQWNDKVIHFHFQDTYQDRDSRLNSIAIQMGGRVYRNESVIHLQGQGAENKVLGVLFGNAEQNFENWITQNHTAKKTISDIQYRGALKGKAHSFFSGLVSIVKEAQQSDAFQSSKSLLLSKDARADAIPNLEILADDVKCSHGAAVGPVDEDQKFYLQTRGVTPNDAEKIIIEGFFEPVIAEVPSEPTQERLRSFIEEKLNSK